MIITMLRNDNSSLVYRLWTWKYGDQLIWYTQNPDNNWLRIEFDRNKAKLFKVN